MKEVCIELYRYHTVPTFKDLGEKTFENIVEKEENAANQLFLIFPQSFLPFQKTNFNS